MAVRERIASLLERTVTSVREVLEEPDGTDSAQQEAIAALARRIDALEATNAKLEKRLSMAMGAIQAATAQLVQVKEAAAQAQNQGQQAMQRATSAQTTAEAAAEGIASFEEQLRQLGA